MNYSDRKVINEKIREELNTILSDQSLELSADERRDLSELEHLICDDNNGVLDYFTPASTLVANNERWNRVGLLCAEIMLEDNPDIYHYQFCGKMLIANQRHRSAIELLEKAIDEHEGILEYEGELANFYSLLSYATLENGSPRGAISYATKALSLCVSTYIDAGNLFTTFTSIAEGKAPEENDKNSEDARMAMDVLQRASQLIKDRSQKNDSVS